MLAYKHVLLATDLSEGSPISETTLRMVRRSQAKLSIVHVLEHTPVVYGGGEFSIPLDMSLEEQLTKNARKALAVIAHRLEIKEQDQYIAHGSIKWEIIDLAEQLKADLIIVGSHSHHGVAALLGATANAVLHAAKCDVLAVRAEEL